MQISFVGGSGFSSAPSGLTTALSYVQNLYDTIFTQPVILQITVNWQPVAPGFLARNGTGLNQFGYAAVYNGLTGREPNAFSPPGYPTLQQDYQNLSPNFSPTGSNNFFLTTTEQTALGLISSSTVNTGGLTLGSQFTWSYTPGLVPTGGNFYIVGTIEHEVSEMMGRGSNDGTSATLNNNQVVSSTYQPLDLFRYYAPGVRDLTAVASGSTANTTAYFSINGGTTNLGGGLWNNVLNGSDLGDWVTDPIPFDAYGSGTGNVIFPISQEDITIMNAIGWNLSPDVVYPGETLNIPDGQTSTGLMVIAGGVSASHTGGTVSQYQLQRRHRVGRWL